MYKMLNEPLGQLLKRKLQYTVFRQKWNIGITGVSAAVVAGLEGSKEQQQALDEILWMQERREAFAADPFIIKDESSEHEYLIFYEWFPWRQNRGRIDCVGFTKGHFETSKICLESPYHLSYPFILEHQGQLLMIPEHSEASDLSMYHIDKRGVANKKKTIGAHLALLDSTIIYRDEKYWMFATHAGPKDNAELHIYFADDLKGPWKKHAQNPVKTDKTNARPAGEFIHYGSSLFRPAQDCGAHYGAGIIINEVKNLSEDEFEEIAVSEIRPRAGSRYGYGLHTISSAGEHTVIDGSRLESSIHPIFDRFGRYIAPVAAE